MTLFSLIVSSKLEQTSQHGVISKFDPYISSLRYLYSKKLFLCAKPSFFPIFYFRWLRKMNPGSISCRKLCFRWLINYCSICLSHQKPYFCKIVIIFPSIPFQLWCWSSGTPSSCIRFGKTSTSCAASGFRRLTAASTRVSSAKWVWELGFDF